VRDYVPFVYGARFVLHPFLLSLPCVCVCPVCLFRRFFYFLTELPFPLPDTSPAFSPKDPSWARTPFIFRSSYFSCALASLFERIEGIVSHAPFHSSSSVFRGVPVANLTDIPSRCGGLLPPECAFLPNWISDFVLPPNYSSGEYSAAVSNDVMFPWWPPPLSGIRRPSPPPFSQDWESDPNPLEDTESFPPQSQFFSTAPLFRASPPSRPKKTRPASLQPIFLNFAPIVSSDIACLLSSFYSCIPPFFLNPVFFDSLLLHGNGTTPCGRYGFARFATWNPFRDFFLFPVR